MSETTKSVRTAEDFIKNKIIELKQSYISLLRRTSPDLNIINNKTILFASILQNAIDHMEELDETIMTESVATNIVEYYNLKNFIEGQLK